MSQLKDTLVVLQARGDHFTRQLLQEKQRVVKLETQMQEADSNISDIRESNKKKAIELLNMYTTTTNGAYNRADGLNPTRVAQMNQAKLVNNLEGRLNKALIRQKSIEIDNKTIKAKIDNLRRKVLNDSSNRKSMEKRIKVIQDEVDDIMNKAASASEQRDKIMEFHNQSVHENMGEKEKFEEEYDSLTRFIFEQNELLQGTISSVSSGVVSKINKLDSTCCQSDSREVGPKEEIKALDEKIAMLDRQYNESMQMLSETEDKNRSYEETFQRLQEVSGIISTEDITKAFVKNEEESFSTFSYIQALNQECDNTLEEHATLRMEMETLAMDQVQQENQRSSIVAEYQRRLLSAQEETFKLNDGNEVGRATILQIAQRVQTLYADLNCVEIETKMTENGELNDKSSDTNLPSRGDEPERNILSQLELIEKRFTQVVAEYAKALISRRDSKRPSVVMSKKSFRRSTSARSYHAGDEKLKSAEIDDYDDDDSNDDGSVNNRRPMSVHDMRLQAAEKMREKNNSEEIINTCHDCDFFS